MAKQKFHKGDLVHVKKDLGPHKSHFHSGVNAVVYKSYHEQYGGGNRKSYTLYFKGRGEVSWYEEDELILIKAAPRTKTFKQKAEELLNDYPYY